MAVAVSNRTLAQVVKETLRLCGWVLNEGTSTAGSTTSLTDAANERTPTAQSNAIIGQYLWMHSGTGIGQQAEIISYTIGVPVWSPTLTSPAADTGWLRVTKRPQRAIDAIAEVTREAAWKQAIPVMYTALVTNNLMEDLSDFERWPDGTTTASPGWTLAGAGSSIARESPGSTTDGTPSGVYYPAITAGAGAIATFTFTVEAKYLPLIRGNTLTLQGWMEEAVAGDVTVRVTYTNSANVVTNNDTAGTYAGNWESIGGYSGTGVQIALPDPTTNLSVQVRIALSATSRVDDLMLYGPYIYDYPLPSQAIGLEPVIYMENAFRSKNFSIPLYHGADWIVRRRESAPSTTKYDSDAIHFFNPLPSGRHLRMTTYQAPSVQTTQSSSVDPNPVWLALAAAVRLMEQEDIEPKSSAERRLNNLRVRLAQMEATPEGNVLTGVPFVPIESR